MVFEGIDPRIQDFRCELVACLLLYRMTSDLPAAYKTGA
jgi:hypothetical protein